MILLLDQAFQSPHLVSQGLILSYYYYWQLLDQMTKIKKQILTARFVFKKH
jgi:hypothetical protein